MPVQSFLSRRVVVAVVAAAVLCGAAANRAQAEAMLLVEASTGKVLHAENATYPWYPASVTKLMTLYTTLRAVQDRKLTLDTPLLVSKNAVAQQPTKMGFKLGVTVTVDNALKMLMVKSANDVAVTLAEGVGGSLEGFADMMNADAKRLGMTQSHFVNPNGLPAENHVSSARDLAMLARALINDFPQYDSYLHVHAIRYGNRVMRNYNNLLDRYPGADGMKTGFICASGYNLVASATRNGRRLIAVVLGSYSGATRAQKAAQLLERGFGDGGLTWLTPSLGTVEKLAPIDAAPPNLRDEMCGGHRRKPPSEDNQEDDVTADASTSTAPGSEPAFMLSNMKQSAGKFVLGPPVESVPPVVVFTGPANQPDAVVVATAGPKKPKKKVAAAKPEAGDKPKTASAKPTSAKPASEKPASEKPASTAKPASAAKPASDKKPAAAPAASSTAKPKVSSATQ